MKKEIILAFKKVLASTTNFNDIQIDEPTERIFGGYTYMVVGGNFSLKQAFNEFWIEFKSTQETLTYNEWIELDKLVRSKKTELQHTSSCEDYVELQKILKS